MQARNVLAGGAPFRGAGRVWQGGAEAARGAARTVRSVRVGARGRAAYDEGVPGVPRGAVLLAAVPEEGVEEAQEEVPGGKEAAEGARRTGGRGRGGGWRI